MSVDATKDPPCEGTELAVEADELFSVFKKRKNGSRFGGKNVYKETD